MAGRISVAAIVIQPLMIFSLLIALTLTPYFGYLFLRHKSNKKKTNEDIEKTEEEEVDLHQSRIYKIYAGAITPFLESRKKRWTFMVLFNAASCASTALMVIIWHSRSFSGWITCAGYVGESPCKWLARQSR